MAVATEQELFGLGTQSPLEPLYVPGGHSGNGSGAVTVPPRVANALSAVLAESA